MAKDKKLHLIAGALLSSFGFLHPPLFALGFVAGVLKEIYDIFRPKNTPDIMDTFYTWYGAFIPLSIYIIISLTYCKN